MLPEPAFDQVRLAQRSPVRDGDEMQAMAVTSLESQRLVERAHGEEGVDAEVVGHLEPEVGVTVGEQVAVGVDDAAADGRAGHRARQRDVRSIVFGRGSGGWVGELHRTGGKAGHGGNRRRGGGTDRHLARF